jgi:hypothetical protein
VRRFVNKEATFKKRQKAAKRKMTDACERALIFGTPKQAVVMLDKFERMKF